MGAFWYDFGTFLVQVWGVLVVLWGGFGSDLGRFWGGKVQLLLRDSLDDESLHGGCRFGSGEAGLVGEVLQEVVAVFGKLLVGGGVEAIVD